MPHSPAQPPPSRTPSAAGSSGAVAASELRNDAERQLSFNGARPLATKGAAISGGRLTVDQDVFCRHGFTAHGAVSLPGARIGGRLDFTDASLDNPQGHALALEAAQIDTLILRSRIAGQVDLRGARLGTLDLLMDTHTRLSGLTYTDLGPGRDPPVGERIAWLRSDPGGFRPQPYEQLARYYRGLGHDRDARVVLLARRRSRRRTLPAARRLPGWLHDALAGYGYVPLRALCWLVAAWVIGTAFSRREMVPQPTSDNDLNAALYALDVLLPASPLHLEERFTPHGAALGVSIALQAIGWALSIAVLPAITRALSRSE